MNSKIISILVGIILIATIIPMIPNVNAEGINWVEATAHAGWSPRTNGYGVITFDNKMWVMGGYAFNGSFLNDVWSSSDGMNWIEATASANWTPRVGLSALVFDNKMWVLGGYDATGPLNDAWYSTDGANWIESTANANWSKRYVFQSTVYDNKMWIIGGADTIGPLNETWYSTDGVNWIEATAHAGWTARTDFRLEVFNNKMWVMGGNDWVINYNDTWYSTDGVNWNEATTTANWSARSGFTSAVFENRLWVMGGYGPEFNAVWYSTDGANWVEATAHAQWSPRFNFAATVYDKKLWVMGGYNYSGDFLNDVWYDPMPTPATINITLNPSGTANIIVNPTFWNPSASIGGNTATAPDAFTLDNNGTIQVDVTVNASDTSAWTLATAPGHNQFQMQYGTESGGGMVPASLTFPVKENMTSELYAPTSPFIAAFNSTYFVAAWCDPGAGLTYVRIGKYATGGFSWVTDAYDITEGGGSMTDFVAVAVLDSTHFVVVWHDAMYVAGLVSARVGNISTGSIVMSDFYDTGITSDPDTCLDISAFDSNYFIIFYDLVDAHGAFGMVGYYDGTDITFGSQNPTLTTTSHMNRVETLDSTHCVVTYTNTIAGYHGRVRCGERSGTSITWKNANTFSPDWSFSNDITKINSTYFALAYDNDSSAKGELLIGRFDNPGITIVSPIFTFANYPVRDISLDMLDATHFAIVYMINWSGETPEQQVSVGEYSGGTVTWLAQATLLSPVIDWMDNGMMVYRLNDTTFTIVTAINYPNTFIGEFTPEGIGGGGTIWTNLSISPSSFVSDFAWDQSQPFGLQLFMPTSSSTAANQTATITFIATMD